MFFLGIIRGRGVRLFGRSCPWHWRKLIGLEVRALGHCANWGRYYPAIIAQAAATLDNMYPGRIMLGVGTGEALNERPFWNDRWPKWEERMDRLAEGILTDNGNCGTPRNPSSSKANTSHQTSTTSTPNQELRFQSTHSAMGKLAAHADRNIC